MHDQHRLRTQHLQEFDDWQVLVPFRSGEVKVICCPEDKVCKATAGCGPSSVCKYCSVPACTDCRLCVFSDPPTMPPGCLSNDMMVFYAQPELYTEAMTVIEMICCSVCITSMICFSLEVKYGNLFDTKVHMHRHRVGARGNATTFPMPWQQLLAELQNLDADAEQSQPPDIPKVGSELVHVVQVTCIATELTSHTCCN